MTIRKLYKKYQKLQNQKYETICITQVLSDLRQIISKQNLQRYIREGKIK